MGSWLFLWPLGALLARLGAPLAAFGLLLAAVGPLLGRSWPSFGCSRPLLTPSWSRLVRFGSHLGVRHADFLLDFHMLFENTCFSNSIASEAILEPNLGRSWVVLGLLGGHLG